MDEDFCPDSIKIVIPSDPKWMDLVRNTVSSVTSRLKFRRSQIRHLTLAVDEACTNVIKHAYLGNKKKEIIIYFKIFDDRLEILIKDFGIKGEPNTFRSRDLNDVRPGGLGIHFINRVMDEVNYDTSPPVGTELRLVKYRKKWK